MKKKYLYNGQLMDQSDIEDAAKQSNMDVNAYIQKVGIKPVDDNYIFGGKTVSASDVLEAAKQSNMDFHDYLDKAGVKKKDGGTASVNSASGGGTTSSPTKSPLASVGNNAAKATEPNFNFIDGKGNPVVHNEVQDDPVGNVVRGLQAQKNDIVNRNISGSDISTGVYHHPQVVSSVKALDNQINDVTNSAFQSAQEAQNYIKNKLQGKTVTKEGDIFNQEHPVTPETNLEDYDANSIKNHLDKNNITDQIAFDRVRKDINLNKSINSSVDLNEAALKYEATQSPQLKRQIDYLQSTGQKLPEAMEGTLVANFLNNPDVVEKAQTNPEFAKHYDETKRMLLFKYPEYGKRIVAQKIAQAREDRGMNNGIVNIPTQSSTDELVNDLYAKGQIGDAEKSIYENSIRPSLGVMNSIGRGIGRLIPGVQANVDESPIPTPGFLENTENSYVNSLQGMAHSIEDISPVKGIFGNRLPETFKKDYSAVSINPVGAWHQFTQSSGNLTGFVLPMIMGGVATKAAGLSENMGQLITNGLMFEGNNKDAAMKMFPDDPTKQFLYTTLATGGDMMLGKLIPTKEARAGVQSLLKNDIKSTINDLVDGKINAAAAKQSLLEKATGYIGNVAKGNVHTGAAMAGFSLFHNALDSITGGRDVSGNDAANELVESFKTGFLGGTVLSIMAGAKGGDSKLNGKVIREMADHPQTYATIITDQAKLHPGLEATKDEKLTNLADAVAINNDLSKTDLTDAQKEKYMIQALNQRVWERKADETTDDVIKKKYLDEADKSKVKKEKIYNGTDKATEHESYTEPEIEQPKTEESQNEVPVITTPDSPTKTSIDKPLPETTEQKEVKIGDEVDTPLGKAVIDRVNKNGATIAKLKSNGSDMLYVPEQWKGMTSDETTQSSQVKEVNTISDAIKKHDEVDNYTFQDMVNDVEHIANETGNPKLIKAVEDYRKAQEEDSQLSGRGDMDSAEKEFEKVLNEEKESGQNVQEETPSTKPAVILPSENERLGQPKREVPPPEEPKPEGGDNNGENKVGVSHASLTELAKRLGLKEPQRGDYIEPHEYAERGRALLKAGATLDDVNDTKNELHDRISIARAHQEDLIEKADKIGKESGTNSQEYKDALNELDSYVNDNVKKLGTLAHRAFVSLQGERDLNTGSFTVVKKAFEDNKGAKATPEQEAKITQLTKDVEIYKKRAQEAEAKLIEETDKNIGEKRETEKKISDLGKQIARVIRDGKLSRPDSFSAATPASLVWDGAIEIAAKTVETTADIVQAIADGIEHIKNSDWYKGLTDEKKAAAEKDFTGYFEKVKERGLTKANNIEELQKLFADKRGNKFSPEEAKALWGYAKSEYLEKGVPYRDMISYLSNDTGLSYDQVFDAITTPKTRPIADAMYIKQKDLRKQEIKTREYVENARKSTFTKIIEAPDKVMRGTAVFGHAGIFVGTHAGMTMFDLPRAKYTIKAFANGYKLAYGSEAKYERAMQKLKSDPNYILAQRAGLQNDPNETKTDQYQSAQKYFGKAGGVFRVMAESGVKGFNAIKVLRQDLFNDHWSRLSPAEKADPSVARSIAELVNNATGGTNLDLKLRDKQGNIVVNPDKIMFAANMEAARWEKLTKNPIKATKTALTALFSDKATPAEKVFAKVWASRVGWELSTYAALAVTNAAIQSYLNPKNPVNLTDPTKPDYMKFKANNTDINMTSGMLGAIDFIAGLVNNSIKTKKERKGDNVLQADAKNFFQYGRGKLSPFAATLVDLKTGTDFSNNTLPTNSDKPSTGKRQLSWGEYLFEKAPIPVADAAKAVYEGMQDNGMSKTKANLLLHGLVAFIEAGSTGFRISESTPPRPTPFNDEDKKDPTFKYFLDKGLELPNVQPQSTPITDEKAGTEMMLSHYSKEIQDKFQEVHKKELKEKLSEIKSNKTVYVRHLHDENGKPISKVSLEEPEKGNAKETRLDDLSTEELAQVLRIAQSQATKKAKEKIFKTNE